MVIYVLNGYFIMLILVIIQFILSIAGLIEWYESYLEQGRNKIMFWFAWKYLYNLWYYTYDTRWRYVWNLIWQPL